MGAGVLKSFPSAISIGLTKRKPICGADTMSTCELEKHHYSGKWVCSDFKEVEGLCDFIFIGI